MIKRKVLLIAMSCLLLIINRVSAQEAQQVTAEEQAVTAQDTNQEVQATAEAAPEAQARKSKPKNKKPSSKP